MTHRYPLLVFAAIALAGCNSLETINQTGQGGSGGGDTGPALEPCSSPDECHASPCYLADCGHDGFCEYYTAPAGTDCAVNDGKLCDDAGQCVQCAAPESCPGADTECAYRTCNAGKCGLFYSAVGMGSQIIGDCAVIVCDGTGGESRVPDLSDLPPPDNTGCSTPACSVSGPQHVPLPNGTPCGSKGVCQGGLCVQIPPTPP